MTNSVTVNSVTYTDDADVSTGLANGGHRTRLVPMFSNTVIHIDDKLSTMDSLAAQVASDKDTVTTAAATVAGAIANTVTVTTLGESLVGASTQTSARGVIGAASLSSNTYSGDQNLGGNSAINQSLKEVTPSLNTGTTPNELTIDFTTGHKASHTVTGNRKIIPVFPANGSVGILDLINAGTATITFSSGKKTAGGASLTFTTSGTDRLTFIGTSSDYEVVIRKDIKA